MSTETEILEETGGDLLQAFRIACACYDQARRMVSAGYARANTSDVKWGYKPPPDTRSTNDDWIGTPERPE